MHTHKRGGPDRQKALGKGQDPAELLLECLTLESSSTAYSPICKPVVRKMCIGDRESGTCSRAQAADDIPVPLSSDELVPVARLGWHATSAAMSPSYRAAMS